MLRRAAPAEASCVHRALLQTFSAGARLTQIEAGGTRLPPHPRDESLDHRGANPLVEYGHNHFKMDGEGMLRFVAERMPAALEALRPGLSAGGRGLLSALGQDCTPPARRALPEARAAPQHRRGEEPSTFPPAGLSRGLGDIRWVVPHQASGIALDSLAVYNWPPAQVVRTLAKYGNCVAASLPLTLYEGVSTGQIRRGDKVLLCGTAAGGSFGGIILTY